jgi:hypothetical protein
MCHEILPIATITSRYDPKASPLCPICKAKDEDRRNNVVQSADTKKVKWRQHVIGSQLINHHSFRFANDPNLASKRSVEVMWQDENSLEAASFMPEESPSKSRKGSSASSILRSAGNSSVLVEHRCGTKKIEMVFDDNEAIRPLPDLLIDKLPAEEPAAPALSLFQIRRIQSTLASTSEESSSDDDSSISGDGLDFLDAPPLVDGGRSNNDFDVG